MYVADMTVGTGVGLVLPMLAAKLVPAGVALDRQEVQLVAVRLEAVRTKLWKLHLERF